MPIKLTKNHLVYMNIGKRYWSSAWSDLSSVQRRKVTPYRRDIERAIREGRGLYLWGPNGSGKTYIGTILCKLVWAEYRVTSYCVTAGELKASWVKEIPAHYGSEELRSERVAEVPFLFIDDLTKEYRTDSGFFEDSLDLLLRGRIRDEKVTIITTNVGPKQFADIYGDSIKGLIMESTGVVHLDGENMRVPQAEENFRFVSGDARE